LRVGHGVDAGVVFGPDAVVDDQDVEASEALNGGGDEGLGGFGAGEVAGDGVAVVFTVVRAALLDQLFRRVSAF